MTADSIDELVRPELRDEWTTAVKPRWFATDTIRSQKMPGLLKSEFAITTGEFVALSYGFRKYIRKIFYSVFSEFIFLE